MRGDESELLVFHPLFEGYHIACHVPHLLYKLVGGASLGALNVEGVEDVEGLGADGLLVGDIVGDGPHLLPVELFGVEPHTVVEVGLVDIEVHHAGIGPSYLCDIGVAEAAAHLCGTAPVCDLGLHLWVAALHHTRDHGVALACALQVGHHLAHCAAGIEFAEPRGYVGVGIVGRFLLLHVHQHHRHVEVAHGGQHIVRGGVGEQLQDDEIDIGSAEFVAGRLCLFFGGHHASVDDFHGLWQCLFECLVLAFELRYELWELWQVGSQCDGEHPYPCFGFN